MVIHAPSRVWFWPEEDEKITEVTATLPTTPAINDYVIHLRGIRFAGEFPANCDLRHGVCLPIWFNLPQTYRGNMSDPLADTTARLQRLLEVVMQERDQAKCDELSEEIWRVLEEREAIKEALTERES
jgi:hypothetical protein